MAIVDQAIVIATPQWPQGDIRDPLGVWGCRLGVTGDASGGSIKVQFQVPPGLAAAYVYTVYSINIAILTGVSPGQINGKARILTNWPNVDSLPGVQSYSSLIIFSVNTAANFTAPIGGIANQIIMSSSDRFMLCYDPRPSASELDIVEVEIGTNTDLATHSFEGYGYFWDRSVLQAPGGPRHPGSS